MPDAAHLAFPSWYVLVSAFAALGLVLLCAVRGVDRLFHGLFRRLGRLSRRRWMPHLMVAAVSLSLAAFVSIVVSSPVPRVHDEFSYLLAADTFAHGRLTNPPLPDPLWQHFETMHVIQQPTYASKYPPAQGMSLALGQVLTGHPIVGAWMTTALACVAVWWLLLAWLPPRWALLGGLLLAIHVQTVSWSQSYWGGQVAMLGGSLLLGAVFRLGTHGPLVSLGLVLGLGIAILANSRPSEGLFLSLLVLVILIQQFATGRLGDWSVVTRRLVLPILAVLLPVGVFMGYYNYRVTGSPLQMPYMVHDAQYAVAPPFIWQNPRVAPNYRHETIRDLQMGWELPYYTRQQTWSGLAREVVRKAASVAVRYLDPTVLALTLVPLPFVWRRDRRIRFAFVLLVTFFLIAALTQTWTRAHYVAPAAGLGIYLVVQGLRYLRLWQRQGRQTGRIVVRCILCLCGVTLLLWGLIQAESGRKHDWAAARAAVIDQLEDTGEKHLILVRYEPGHDMMMEWVANPADWRKDQVLWAREMGPTSNHQLLNFFSDRRAWLLAPATLGFDVEPYHAATTMPADE